MNTYDGALLIIMGVIAFAAVLVIGIYAEPKQEPEPVPATVDTLVVESSRVDTIYLQSTSHDHCENWVINRSSWTCRE